jgi:carbonic anhydrase
LEKLTVGYQPSVGTLLNNGHTIQYTPKENHYLQKGENSYKLLQFHFHSPSENLINGQSYPLEAHFVHKDENNQFLVFAVLFKEGKSNSELSKLWTHIPKTPASTQDIGQVNMKNLLPKSFKYYRFSGSLTVPPCTEGIIWLVADQHPTVSKEQIDQFNQVMGHATNRPVQPISGRVISY